MWSKKGIKNNQIIPTKDCTLSILIFFKYEIDVTLLVFVFTNFNMRILLLVVV